MVEIKKSTEPKDYKERFEFKLTVGDNIICQRYFKINNFNPRSIRSYELAQTIRECANRIDADLKDKTQIYMSYYAPMYFESIDEMDNYYANPENCYSMSIGDCIVVKGEPVDYLWNGEFPQRAEKKYYDGELLKELTEDDRIMYKFAFFVDEKEVCSAMWEGVYPNYVRNSIDLSNKRGRLSAEEKKFVPFEMYLLNKMVEGKSDLIWNCIKEICYVCTQSNDSDFYTVEANGYKNTLSRKFWYLRKH